MIAMKMDLKEKTLRYMRRRGLARAEMARLIGKGTVLFSKYLDGIRISPNDTEWVEAALDAFYYRLEQRERRRPRKFINLLASKLVLERCEEARRHGDLVLLYGPPGTSKTYTLEEYVQRRTQQGDDKIIFMTANPLSTPRALVVGLCKHLGLPSGKPAHVLVGWVIQKLEADPHLILVDEANHLSVGSLELLRHIHDLSHCGMVLVGTKRLYDLFTNGGRKSQDLEQLWSRVAVHDLLPGMAPSEVQAIVHSSLGRIREGVAEEIQKTSKGSIRRLTKLTARLKRLQELNPDTPLEKLVPIAAGQIIV